MIVMVGILAVLFATYIAQKMALDKALEAEFPQEISYNTNMTSRMAAIFGVLIICLITMV